MIEIGGSRLIVSDVVKVARYCEKVELSPESIVKMQKSREVVEQILKEERAIYGVNTGFGAFANVKIPKDDLLQIQKNILLSHACGVGEPLSEEIVRAMMLIRAHSLSLGFSGVRPVIVKKLCEFLNKGVTPYVPSKGSVGSSGDLAPLAHIALPLIGEGYILKNGVKVPAKEVLLEKNIDPLILSEKEGLSLVNGTQAMAAILSIVVNDVANLIYLAVRVAALVADVLMASPDAYEDIVWISRPHRGQKIVAKLMKELFEGSQIRESHRNCSQVQDAYSLRCIPQVYGAVLDCLEYVKKIVEIELNSATDNPLVFGEKILSQGNFHGEPLALSADFLAISLSDFGNMVERQIDRMVNPKVNANLPPFLVIGDEGTNSGYMIWQYTAAALCNENKILSHSASVDTIPTSGYQEDHVSMGMNACLKLMRIYENIISLVSIELMCATRALQLRRPLKTSPKNEELFESTVPLIDKVSGDSFVQDQFERIRSFVLEKTRVVMNEWWRSYE
ncbi:histidine ammonia-lyase [Pseudothermotoga lettingae]|nr:histidine ammonia-lyase [Pseudothermotoga lettingae]GLI47905.1 histidine ammonia-lyase [Pseudothermotoga lettingae TMO]